MQEIDRLLDKTKIAAFTDTNAAFLAVVLCSLEFMWDESIPRAATNGLVLRWNPNFFLELSPAMRKTVLIHELYHVARAHPLRFDGRDVRAWQYACDVVINNDLHRSGYVFDPNIDHIVNFDYPEGTAEEEIYNDIIENSDYSKEVSDEHLDIILNEKSKQAAMDNLIQINEIIKLTPGLQSGNFINSIVNKILPPKVNWKAVLYNFMSEHDQKKFSYSRRNRRFTDIYMPSLVNEESLAEINYYIDVSGSVSDEDICLFNSELRYLMSSFNLEGINLIQFDTVITKEEKINDTLLPIVVVGRGGTRLDCVHDHIMEHRPSHVIVFSDLDCSPMRAIDYPCEILWIIIHNPHVIPDFGNYVHI